VQHSSTIYSSWTEGRDYEDEFRMQWRAGVWDRCRELCPWRDWTYLSELQVQGNTITVEEKEKKFSNNYFFCPGFVLNLYNEIFFFL
jgi:hypothetical protein